MMLFFSVALCYIELGTLLPASGQCYTIFLKTRLGHVPNEWFKKFSVQRGFVNFKISVREYNSTDTLYRVVIVWYGKAGVSRWRYTTFLELHTQNKRDGTKRARKRYGKREIEKRECVFYILF